MGGLMNGIENAISRDVTDIVNHANSIVTSDIRKLNRGFYEGYQWVAALDSVTCMICANLDNKIFGLLPGMQGDGIQSVAPEQPIHRNCRCIMVPVLIGDSASAHANPNYEDWFDRQSPATQLDILGPSRFKLYQNGMKVTAFANDGRISTLDDLGAQRATRKADIDRKVAERSAQQRQADELKQANDAERIYTSAMTNRQMVDSFKARWPGVELERMEGVSNSALRNILRQYDSLLQRYPINGTALRKIAVNDRQRIPAWYQPSTRTISFSGKTLQRDLDKLTNHQHSIGWFSSPNGNHIPTHEFAHAVDRRVFQTTGRLGREQLLDAMRQNMPGQSMKSVASRISGYAATKADGGEFFAEAFTAWRNESIKNPSGEMDWLLEFFSGILR